MPAEWLKKRKGEVCVPSSTVCTCQTEYVYLPAYLETFPDQSISQNHYRHSRSNLHKTALNPFSNSSSEVLLALKEEEVFPINDYQGGTVQDIGLLDVEPAVVSVVLEASLIFSQA